MTSLCVLCSTVASERDSCRKYGCLQMAALYLNFPRRPSLGNTWGLSRWHPSSQSAWEVCYGVDIGTPRASHWLAPFAETQLFMRWWSWCIIGKKYWTRLGEWSESWCLTSLRPLIESTIISCWGNYNLPGAAQLRDKVADFVNFCQRQQRV